MQRVEIYFGFVQRGNSPSVRFVFLLILSKGFFSPCPVDDQPYSYSDHVPSLSRKDFEGCTPLSPRYGSFHGFSVSRRDMMDYGERLSGLHVHMTAAGSSEKIRAVVFHQGALGDFLMAASAIDELAGTYGLARIDFWSKPEHVSLLTGKSYLGQCHSPDDALIARLLQDSLWRTATLPDFLLKADILFIFGQAGSRLMAERLSTRLSAKVYRVQSFPAGDNARTHVSRFLSRQLKDLGWSIGGKPLTLSGPVSEKQAARELLRELGIHARPVFIHPGSGGRRKVWPLANWHGLLNWIQRELPLQALLSIGPADDYMDQFSVAVREAGVPIVSGLPLLRLSALLSLCELYIGSDSGVSHLAAATGIPAITVFGPTDPRVWAPQGRNAVAVRRTWKKADGFTWAPSEKPDFQDREIADLVKSSVSLQNVGLSSQVPGARED